MRLHGNARTCLHSRFLIVERVLEQGWTVAAAAEAAGVSARTAAKWLARYRSEGRVGLVDRSSAPRRLPRRTPAQRVRLIELLRRLRMTAAEIAEVLRMPLSTVSAVLKRIGLGKRSRLEPFEPANRYECARAGELVHIDVKKLGRFTRPGHRLLGRGPGRFEEAAGYEYVHVCVDDFSRLAYVEILADERALTAIGFLRRALDWFAAQGVRIERVMTDNGSAYRSHAHALACRTLGLRIYASSAERARALPIWLNHYNYVRPHASLGKQPPGARLNNVSRNYN
jgi:transposase InsO family protein